MTFVSNFQADFYGPALCELCSFKCSSLYSRKPFFHVYLWPPFTLSPHCTRGEHVGACVLLAVARLVLQAIFRTSPSVKRYGACAENGARTLPGIKWMHIPTVIAFSLCFTLKLQSGIEKRMLITLASGYIVYMPTNAICPLYMRIYIKLFVFR